MAEFKTFEQIMLAPEVALQQLSELEAALDEACAALEAVADPPEKSHADLPPIQMIYIQCITAARKGRELLRAIS